MLISYYTQAQVLNPGAENLGFRSEKRVVPMASRWPIQMYEVLF